jgi:hypothetical protein
VRSQDFKRVLVLIPNNPFNLIRSNGHYHEATYLNRITEPRVASASPEIYYLRPLINVNGWSFAQDPSVAKPAHKDH